MELIQKTSISAVSKAGVAALAILVVVIVPGLDHRDVYRAVVREEGLPRTDVKQLLDDQLAGYLRIDDLDIRRALLSNRADVAVRHLGLGGRILDRRLGSCSAGRVRIHGQLDASPPRRRA